ncbi:tRNA (guanosine(37)-N1)-methyltransferase TrmD [Peptoniphilus stercorisuis]|uniref:tRNA (guanine-N(1)-)-methyltransferase n=1 Tax=Peptoniphilus stercorisuis TaxID=1436965 RepID=A0ABS4KBM7_9FIRM|nr:tRNA (guanosine(37)-N1)-methyltransferase TrmD [Peptoniphilus stercorisuis]MBP2025177.1 tRNA (guanine37-N1)-methyltransferase [Peptoniphilus stercorisuis]
MKFSILTLFPEFFDSLNDYSIIGRAIKEEKIKIESVNIRDFSENKHGQVDDYSYGGGPGMVMQPGPIYRAIKSVKQENSKVIYLSPQGKVLTQEKLNELSRLEHIVLLNGHYEGIDNRIVENYVDEELSLGDFVLTGGEIASMTLIDGVTRLLPGVLSSKESYESESHYNGLLEYPQYTRPQNFNDFEVPEVLLSGNHKKIQQYRVYQSIKVTLEKRPDLINRSKLSDLELKYLKDILAEGR